MRFADASTSWSSPDCERIGVMNPERILKGTFMLAAFASFLLSVTIYFQADDMDGRLDGIYVGIWVPSILALGTFVLAHRGPSK